MLTAVVPYRRHSVMYLLGDVECQCLLAVFSHLTTAELCRVARVSRKWYTVSKHPNLWRRVSIGETVITSQVSETKIIPCTFITLSPTVLVMLVVDINVVSVHCTILCESNWFIQTLVTLSQWCSRMEQLSLHGMSHSQPPMYIRVGH